MKVAPRNVAVMSLAVFALIAGEQLWTRFLPKYLSVLGAPALALGLWGSLKDFIDASFQYPGGVLSDRLGSQRALLIFTGIAALGYLAFVLAPSWPWLFVGLVLATAWGSLASPAMFALIAESLPPGKRARGFLVQSVLRRVPVVFAPALGGLLVARSGLAGDQVLEDKVATASGVEVLAHHEPVEIHGGGAVEGLTVLDRETGTTAKLPVQGVFVEIGLFPNTAFALDLVDTNERGEIVVDSHCRTGVRGVFAAGDCTDTHDKQIVISVGEGAKAALAAFEYLVAQV